MARRLAAVAELLGHRIAAVVEVESGGGYAAVDPFQQTAAEVAAAMNLSHAAASYAVSDAEALAVRLPKVATLLAEGKTDWRTVAMIISRTELVSDQELMAKLDESLCAPIGDWCRWSRQRAVTAVDAQGRAIDPDGARERRVVEQGRQLAAAAVSRRLADPVVSAKAALR